METLKQITDKLILDRFYLFSGKLKHTAKSLGVCDKTLRNWLRVNKAKQEVIEMNTKFKRDRFTKVPVVKPVFYYSE